MRILLAVALFLNGCRTLAPGETRCSTVTTSVPVGYSSVAIGNTRCETGQPDPQAQVARDRASRAMVAGGKTEEEAARILDGN